MTDEEVKHKVSKLFAARNDLLKFMSQYGEGEDFWTAVMKCLLEEIKENDSETYMTGAEAGKEMFYVIAEGRNHS